MPQSDRLAVVAAEWQKIKHTDAAQPYHLAAKSLPTLETSEAGDNNKEKLTKILYQKFQKLVNNY